MLSDRFSEFLRIRINKRVIKVKNWEKKENLFKNVVIWTLDAGFWAPEPRHWTLDA